MWSLLASSSGYQGRVPLTQASTSMAANRSSGSARCAHKKKFNRSSPLPTHRIPLAKKAATKKLQQRHLKLQQQRVSACQHHEQLHAVRWPGSLPVHPMPQSLLFLFVLASQHPRDYPQPASACTCRVGTPRHAWVYASTTQRCNLRGTHVHTAVSGLARALQCRRDRLRTCYPHSSIKQGSASRWFPFLSDMSCKHQCLAAVFLPMCVSGSHGSRRTLLQARKRKLNKR